MKNKMRFLLLWAMAAVVGFTACNKEDNKGGVNMIDDGMYVIGEATASSVIELKAAMTIGINEANEQKEQSGLYEKYIALEASKPFYIVKVSGGKSANIGGTLDTTTTNGSDYSINGALVQHGKYSIDGPAFTVSKSGLYQVVIYETEGTVAIIPIKWNTNSLGELKEGDFNKEKMTFTATDVTAELGTFKINTWNGWKYAMNTDGTVKVNCNFGFSGSSFKFDGTENALTPGAGDIEVGINDRGIYTITLTWTLGAGWSHTLALTKTADLDKIDPAQAKFSLIGNAFLKETPSVDTANWDYDLMLNYVPAEGLTEIQGLYMALNVTLFAGKEFKIRKDNAWDTNFGYNVDNIFEHDAEGNKITNSNFEDNGGNIKVKAEKTYASISFFYDFETSQWTLTFQE